MDRQDLVARLWAAVPVVERTQQLFAYRGHPQADVRAIDLELAQLKQRFDSLVGGLVPNDYLTPNGLTRIAMTVEEGRAVDVHGAIAVLQERREAEAERAHQGRLARIRQSADHQRYLDAVETEHAANRRLRWAIQDFRRRR